MNYVGHHDHWLDETTPDLIRWSTTFCLWSWKPMARTWKTNVDLTTLPRKESFAHDGNEREQVKNARGTGATTLLVHLISPQKLQSESATFLAPNHVPAAPDTCPHTCHLQASPQGTQLWLVHTRIWYSMYGAPNLLPLQEWGCETLAVLCFRRRE